MQRYENGGSARAPADSVKADSGASQPSDPSSEPLEDTILRGLAAGEVGVWSWDQHSRELYWTPNLEAIHQLPAGSFDGTFGFFENDIHPDDRGPVFEAIKKTLEDGTAYRVEYRLAASGNGEPRWLEARGRAIMDHGRVVGMTGVCQDITSRRRDEEELVKRARQQEAIARLGQLALTELGGKEEELFSAVVEETAKALGVEMCKLLELAPGGEELILRAGSGWKPGLVGAARLSTERESQAGYALKAGGAVVVSDLVTETRFSTPRLLHDHGVVSGLSVLIAGEDGRDYGVLGAHSTRRQEFSQSDVDFLRAVANLLASAIHRNRAVERQELLVRELRHRVGNLLSLITSLFNNSVKGARSAPEVEEKFLARLMSLARTHSLISQGGWRTTELRGLVEAVLEPYKDRVALEGGEVGISADNGMALSLALHELATNAAKYGALAVTAGQVSVAWSLEGQADDRRLIIDWVEHGGPRVAPPAASGFGTRLISTVVERQLNGTLTTDYANTGLKARIELNWA